MPRQLIVFFFQAEDGIRDYKVTGVQTCALPILDLHFLDRKVGQVLVEGVLVLQVLLGLALLDLEERRLRNVDVPALEDRKSVVEGKSVDLGGRRIIKKKKRYHKLDLIV